MDTAANLASFLQETTGSVLGVWEGHMPAAKQRELLGRFLGKGKICIEGDREVVSYTVRVCFGTDYNKTTFSWRSL